TGHEVVTLDDSDGRALFHLSKGHDGWSVSEVQNAPSNATFAHRPQASARWVLCALYVLHSSINQWKIEDVRILYVNRLCIPSADDQMTTLPLPKDPLPKVETGEAISGSTNNRKGPPALQGEDTRCFPYTKQGYTAFKQYIWGRLTHALNKRSDALKQRANVLGRQNVSMEWQTNLLKRKEYLERRAKALERWADAIGRDAL
ncbi:hypothetical protein Tco_0824437, partial [Tanacetum coccineum]